MEDEEKKEEIEENEDNKDDNIDEQEENIDEKDENIDEQKEDIQDKKKPDTIKGNGEKHTQSTDNPGPKVKGKKHYWWKYLLFFIGGFIFAFGSLAGGVAIAGTVISVTEVGNMAGINMADYLTEAYSQKTVLDLVMTFMGGNVDFSSLGGISEVTPLVDTYLEKINDYLDEKLGFTIDKDELYSLQFSEIANWAYDYVIDNATLAGILQVEENSDPILVMLCYPYNEETEEYDYSSPRKLSILFEPNAISDIVNNAKLGSVIQISESDKIMYALKDSKISELNDAVMNLTVGQIIDIDESSSALLKSIKDKKINELSTLMDTLTLGEVMDIDESSSQILKSLKDTKINELADKISTLTLEEMFDCSGSKILTALAHSTIDSIADDMENLTLNDVVDTSGSKILSALANTKINEIGTAINDLTLNQMLDIDSSSPLVLQALANSSLNTLSSDISNLTISQVMDTTGNRFLQYIDPDTKIDEIGDAILDIKITEAFADQIYDEDHQVVGEWKYLLTDSDGVLHEDYTIGNDMDKLTENMKYNMAHSTMQQLYDDGMITLNDTSVLTKTILYKGNLVQVGSLTIEQFLDAFSSL